jgi:hypothetical protein
MYNRNRMIAAAVAVAAVLAAGSGAAVASTAGAKPDTPAQTVSASKTPGPADNGGQDAIVAAVAADLHLSPAQVSAALQPLFTATDPADTSSLIGAAAQSLGVSTQQLAAALAQAKQSLAPGGPAPTVSGSKTPGPADTGGQKPAAPADNGSQAAFVAAVAQELGLSTARVSAALQPLFTSGPGDTSSLIGAAAQSLGVSTQQLAAALAQAKQSLAPAN